MKSPKEKLEELQQRLNAAFKKKAVIRNLKCQWCGEPFQAIRSTAKYHSKNCKNLAYYARKAAKENTK